MRDKEKSGVTIIDAVKILRQIGFESLGRQTLRQYEEAGLISPERKKKSKYRIFNYSQIDRLELILTMRDLDFSIDEIRKLFDYWDHVNQKCVEIFKKVRDKGYLDAELEKKAKIVKEEYQEQINFLQNRIMGKIQENIAILELRLDKQKQKINRLKLNCEKIDEFLKSASRI